MTQTDLLIQELSKLFADNSYSKDFIKERLDNLAQVAAIERQIEQANKEIARLTRINPTYSLGAIGLIEPEQVSDDDNSHFDHQL
jgi:hypothetical protein